MSNKCPIDGCGWAIGDDKLMCLAHWKLVPMPLKTKVSATWRNFSRARPANRLNFRRPYLEAKQAAIDSVKRLGPLA